MNYISEGGRAVLMNVDVDALPSRRNRSETAIPKSSRDGVHAQNDEAPKRKEKRFNKKKKFRQNSSCTEAPEWRRQGEEQSDENKDDAFREKLLIDGAATSAPATYGEPLAEP